MEAPHQPGLRRLAVAQELAVLEFQKTQLEESKSVVEQVQAAYMIRAMRRPLRPFSAFKTCAHSDHRLAPFRPPRAKSCMSQCVYDTRQLYDPSLSKRPCMLLGVYTII